MLAVAGLFGARLCALCARGPGTTVHGAPWCAPVFADQCKRGAQPSAASRQQALRRTAARRAPRVRHSDEAVDGRCCRSARAGWRRSATYEPSAACLQDLNASIGNFHSSGAALRGPPTPGGAGQRPALPARRRRTRVDALAPPIPSALDDGPRRQRDGASFYLPAVLYHDVDRRQTRIAAGADMQAWIDDAGRGPAAGPGRDARAGPPGAKVMLGRRRCPARWSCTMSGDEGEGAGAAQTS